MQSTVLMAVIATMVYAVSLDLRLDDFRYVLRRPIAVAIGLLAQFGLLPAATLAVTLALDLPPAVEAAMMLVAACPGGALSNVMTYFAGGNLALSLAISAVANVLALVLTPLLFATMIAANSVTAGWLREIALDPRDLVSSLLLLLALPMGLALATSRFAPALAARLRRPLERLAMIALGLFIVAAVAAQWRAFVVELGRTLPLVVLHNALGLSLGAIAATLAGLARADRRAVVIESGMQNSGLALGIIGAQFGADLAMVAVAGLWGIWHIVSGGALAWWWRRADRLSGRGPAVARVQQANLRKANPE